MSVDLAISEKLQRTSDLPSNSSQGTKTPDPVFFFTVASGSADSSAHSTLVNLHWLIPDRVDRSATLRAFTLLQFQSL
jgi:hypothetical protein